MADNFGLNLGIDGEKEFKKALSEINQSFKVLGSEMKLVSSQFDKSDKSVEALTSKNKVLNKEIEAQKEKIETLKSALANAAESFGENDKRTQAWQIQLNNASAALNDMEREVANNEKTIAELSTAEDTAEKETKEMGEAVDKSGEKAEYAKGKFEKFKDTIGKVAKATAAAMTAIAGAAVACGKELWNLANETANYGDEIEKNSQKVGLGFEAYQKWDYAMKISGTDMASCTNGLKTLTNKFDDALNGSKSATESFERLGISVSDLKGKSREEVFSTVVKSLQNVKDETDKAALANDMFGKSGQNLIPLFNLTEEELEGLMQEAEDYGMVMDDSAVKASAAFKDSLNKMQSTFTGLKNNIMGQMLPSLTMVMDGLSDLMAGNENAAENIKNGVSGLIDSITGMVPQVVSLISSVAGAVLESAPAIIEALVTGILDALPQLMPVAVETILAIVDTLIANLPLIIDTAFKIIFALIEGIAQALPDLIPQIIEIVTMIVSVIMENLPMIIQVALELIIALAQGLIQALPELIMMLPQIILAIVKAFKEFDWKTLGNNIIDGLANGIGGSVMKAVDRIKELGRKLISAFKSMFGINSPSTVFAGFGKNLLEGLWNGIKNIQSWLISKLRGLGSAITGALKSVLGIHSPSSVFENEIGKNLGLGIGVGFEKIMKTVKEDMAEAIPTDFDLSATVSAGASMPVSGSYGGITLQLNIENFNNNSIEDIKTLAEEMSTVLAGQMKRKAQAF